jgi:phosphoserine phosphatase
LYTGHIKGSIVYGNIKKEKLKEYFDLHQYSLSNAVAYADHESDIPMLSIVGKSYMVNPDTHRTHLAKEKGIGIMETR